MEKLGLRADGQLNIAGCIILRIPPIFHIQLAFRYLYGP